MYLIVILIIIGTFMSKRYKATFKEVDLMDGFEFERYVTHLYGKMGYRAYTTQASGDFGADVIAVKGRQKLCIQCKRYKGAVGIEAVQQAIGSVFYYKGTRAVVVTNSSYTEAAKILAKRANVLLIDGIELNHLVNKYFKGNRH